MNKYVKNLNRIEFVITFACTGKCKHCSQGEHSAGDYIDGSVAAAAVREAAKIYNIQSVMTFGGEPLLFPGAVCQIHAAARDAGIPARQLITNGFFSRDTARIQNVAHSLARSGVNDILLSVDAFHQETIPLEPVTEFAKAVLSEGLPLRTQPAWLVSDKDDNPYNLKTRDILTKFDALGIDANDGNVIFPSGNALKYLDKYFDLTAPTFNPYEENPRDIRAICINPDGTVLDGNIYETGITEILERYFPKEVCAISKAVDLL